MSGGVETVLFHLNPGSYLVTDGMFFASNQVDARRQCCEIGCIPLDGKLSGEEIDILMSIYTDIASQELILQLYT